ncbi:MAG: hypothetical protein R2697_15785 [Ilumatobacteraceae bacterium]
MPTAPPRTPACSCLHYPIHETYDFRAEGLALGHRRICELFEDPVPLLYARDLDNADGQHISVTHIAGSVTKFMGNGAQHDFRIK